MKVVHMTSVHSPHDVRIYLKECRTLADAGYEVVLIAPGGENKAIDNIRIRAVQRSARRFQRVTKTVLQICRCAIEEDARVYHFHDPELIGVGLLLRVLGKKVIYDVHEDYPDQTFSKSWIPTVFRKPIAKLLMLVEWCAERSFNGIIPATPTIAARFLSGRTVLVQNFPIIGELAGVQNLPISQRPNWIAYVGALSLFRGLHEMVSAMAYLPEYLQPTLKCAGSSNCHKLLDDMKLSPGGDKVEFLGWQNRLQVSELLGLCRLGLVLFHPHPNHINAQPNKLFEFMSVGLPVIASNFPLWRKIVGGAKCGILVDPMDPLAISEAIQWMLEHPIESQEMGMRGHAAVIGKYNWNNEANALLRLYNKVVNQK